MPPHRRICHIPSYSARYFSGGNFRFIQTALDRWTCCRMYSRPLTSDGSRDRSVVFQTLAYISPYDCFLTRRGDNAYVGTDADPGGCLGSCWLEPCDNPISRGQWRRMQRNILMLREYTQNNLRLHVELPFIYHPSQAVQYLLSMQVGGEFDSDAEVSPYYILIPCH